MVRLFTTVFVVFYFSVAQSIWSVVCFAKMVQPCKKAWIWFTLSRTECWKYWENRKGANAPTLFILNLITSNIYERWSCWKLKMQFQTEWIQNQIRLVRKTERYTRKGIPLRKEQICKFYIYYNFWMNFFDTLRQLKHHLLHLSLSKSGNLLSQAKNYMWDCTIKKRSEPIALANPERPC